MFQGRKLCLNCTVKHLGQALVLMTESFKGYPTHKYIAIGHLAEAEDECTAKYSEISKKIRETRLSIQNDSYAEHSIESLIKIVAKTIDRDGSGCACGEEDDDDDDDDN